MSHQPSNNAIQRTADRPYAYILYLANISCNSRGRRSCVSLDLMRRTLSLLVLAIAAVALSQQPTPEYKSRSRRYLDEVRKAALPPDSYKIIAVIGEIKRPGQEFVFTMPARPGLTVSQAIDAAGGFGGWADARAGGVWKDASGAFVTVDVRAFLKKEQDSRDPVLEPGDIVVVLARRM